MMKRLSIRRSNSFDRRKPNKGPVRGDHLHAQRPASVDPSYAETNRTMQGKGENGRLPPNTSEHDGANSSTLKRRSSLRRSLRKFSGSSAPKESVASRLAIEVVPGSFHKVAGISAENGLQSYHSVDGLSPSDVQALRTVELSLGKNRSSRGFDVLQRYQPSSGSRNNGISFVVGKVHPDSIVAAQRLLREGDEVIAINGLPLDTITRMQDVEKLLTASASLKLRIRCVNGSKDARYSPRRSSSSTPVDMPRSATASPDQLPSSDPTTKSEPSETAVGTQPGAVSADRANGISEGMQGLSLQRNGSDSGDVFGRVEQGAATGRTGRELSLTTHDRRQSEGSGGQSPLRPPPPASHLIPTKPIAPLLPERRSSRKIKRRDSLRSAHKILGVSDAPPAPTAMLDMAHVFVDKKDNLPEGQRQKLLAECLAEEFNLPFLVEPATSFHFDESFTD